VHTVPAIAGFACVESVDTSTEMAAFAARSPGRPRAAFVNEIWPPSDIEIWPPCG
jgi:hypothetical protein